MLRRCDDSFQLNTIEFVGSLFIFFISDGPNKADCPQVHRSKSAPQAAGRSEDRPQVRPHRLRSQKAPPLQTRNSRPQGDQKIPEKRKCFLSRSFKGGLLSLFSCLFRLTCSSASFPSRDWCERSPLSSSKKSASKVKLCSLSRRQLRPTWFHCSRIPTCAPSMPRE